MLLSDKRQSNSCSKQCQKTSYFIENNDKRQVTLQKTMTKDKLLYRKQ